MTFAAEAAGYGARRSRPSRRASALWVLAMWTMFLLLNDLQPCCEVLAQSEPNHVHAAVLRQHIDEHGSAALGSVDDHNHCVTSDGISTSLPDFLASATAESDIKFLYIGLVLIVLYSLFSTQRPRPVNHHERGPPPRVYLSTLRLRI